MISILKRCPKCGEPIRVFLGDDLVYCENTDCDSLFRVIRDGDSITLRHFYCKNRPENETMLDMFVQELLV
ncbi:hypothetical protein [uncultured Methanolobus sp.]|uniref:hypothetical protein n=1 Tax=uncultured Methanolobus sp. TaxID=218300 RepID=UPI002AABF345|nr:hypothetical protein [uncultured Methanolobus sp.]